MVDNPQKRLPTQDRVLSGRSYLAADGHGWRRNFGGNYPDLRIEKIAAAQVVLDKFGRLAGSQSANIKKSDQGKRNATLAVCQVSSAETLGTDHLNFKRILGANNIQIFRTRRRKFLQLCDFDFWRFAIGPVCRTT
ncbi:hypothetical protein A3711_00730 [Erythrobacter sp. HI00D59]|nr:hypothetical protein A3711_00730 [Erythrobacter sp. HI00D59]